MTRYIERGELCDLLAMSDDATARALLERMEAEPSAELVVVEPVSAAEMRPTYEIRLAAAQAGQGPSTLGLAAFVAALRAARIEEAFFVTVGSVTAIGLLGSSRELMAVTLVGS